MEICRRTESSLTDPTRPQAGWGASLSLLKVESGQVGQGMFYLSQDSINGTQCYYCTRPVYAWMYIKWLVTTYTGYTSLLYARHASLLLCPPPTQGLGTAEGSDWMTPSGMLSIFGLILLVAHIRSNKLKTCYATMLIHSKACISGDYIHRTIIGQ